MPHVQSYLKSVCFAVDIPNEIAAIPGPGMEPIAFTYTRDVAKYVVAALDLATWDEEMFCYGERATWNDIIRTTEETLGFQFILTYDSVEKLENGEVTELPSYKAAYSVIPKPMFQKLLAKSGLWMTAGLYNIPVDNFLNQRFPEIKPTTIREMVASWKSK